MAYTAPRTSRGFEKIGAYFGPDTAPHLWPLTPNTDFKKGDMVVLTNGLVAKAAANATNVLGVMAQSYTTADNPAGKITYGYVDDNPFNVYRCSFADHRDASATGGTATTLIDTALSTSSDDVWNGAYLYIYEGPGAGDKRIVKDYTGLTDILTVEEPFSATPTTETKYILLGEAGAAGDVIFQGAFGVDLKDENTIDANAANKDGDGPLVVLGIEPENLMMTVMIREHLLNA
jgi:hypothetical protein